MRLNPWFIAALLAAAYGPALHAAAAQNAERARGELAQTLSDLKQSSARQKELARRNAGLRRELSALQQEMVAMGKEVARQEEELSADEARLTALEKARREKSAALSGRQGDLSGMISAMIKLKGLPPEAVIAMPGKLDETLQTSEALRLVTRAVEEEARKIKAELGAMDEIEAEIRGDREKVAKRRAELASRQEELAAKLKERGALVARLGGQERAERERIARLNARSRSLQELVDALKKSEYGWNAGPGGGVGKPDATEAQGEAEPDAAESDEDEDTPGPAAFSRGGGTGAHRLRSFAAAQGKIRPPAAGRIINRFGDAKFGPTFAKGITIETRPEAEVVAPYDGEVVFAGPFRDYGRMIILRHAGGYHTLISGMEDIDCRPGQFLLEGEPIGGMGGGTGAGGERRLYMELRENSQPVDPSDWLRG